MKEKASEASMKHVGVGVGFASEESHKSS